MAQLSAVGGDTKPDEIASADLIQNRLIAVVPHLDYPSLSRRGGIQARSLRRGELPVLSRSDARRTWKSAWMPAPLPGRR
jgi:hypothetical protein